MVKDIFEEERKRFKIVKVDSHHGHKAVIITRKRLGTNAEHAKSSKVSQGQFGEILCMKNPLEPNPFPKVPDFEPDENLTYEDDEDE